MKHLGLRFFVLALVMLGLSLPTAYASVTLGSPSDFNYVPASYCMGGNDPSPSYITTSGGVFSAPNGGIVFVSTATGQIDLSACTPGTWQVRYDVVGSFSVRNITILPYDDATFAYVPDSVCASDSILLLPIVTGLAGGSFSITPTTGINVATGEIDVLLTAPGTYTISYTTNGQCPNIGTNALTVVEQADASFSFTQTNYCTAGTATPVVTGVGLGLFSASPAGLAIDSSTGTIDLENSIADTFIVTYSIQGFCPASFDQMVILEDSVPLPLYAYIPDTLCSAEGLRGPAYYSFFPPTFTGSAGLVIMSNGVIDPGLTSIGVYTVTGQLAGACHEVDVQTVTILDSIGRQIVQSGDTLYAPTPGMGFQWHDANGPISGATSSFFVPTTNGSYSVIYHGPLDPCGTRATLTFVHAADPAAWIGNYHVYPNPSQGRIDFSIALKQASALAWEVQDMMGRTLREGSLGVGRDFAGALDLTDLANGTYTLRFVTPNGAVNSKVMILR